MDFGKIEKVDLKSVRVVSRHSPLRVKIETLLPGEAITVSGVERENIAGATVALRADGRVFTSIKLGFAKFRIVRIK